MEIRYGTTYSVGLLWTHLLPMRILPLGFEFMAIQCRA